MVDNIAEFVDRLDPRVKLIPIANLKEFKEYPNPVTQTYQKVNVFVPHDIYDNFLDKIKYKEGVLSVLNY